jgi:hypothetical protein
VLRELAVAGMKEVYNVPSNNIKPVVEATAAFFGINLPKETRKAYCRKQGVTKEVERSLVPSAKSSKQDLELGGELADLVTYKEIAEGTSIGIGVDGATINGYSVLGGSVFIVKKDGKPVRRMAFAEHVSRETVVNKMRKLSEFFARGKACMEMLQHPLAANVDLERARGSLTDRGGADGKVASALEKRVVRSVQRKLGCKVWDDLGASGEKVGGETLEQTMARMSLYDSAITFEVDRVKAWEAAQHLWDNDQLDKRAVAPDYMPTFFDDLFEATQEMLTVQQLLGLEAYAQLSEEERVVFVGLFCLEHGLSNTLVAIDSGFDEYAREIIPSFIPETTKKEVAFVEVNSSPGNKLCLSFCKLFAQCSDKDWNKSFHYRGWEQEKYGSYSLEDLQAILGSRFGIFFKNAKPILRGWDHAKEYLDEQNELDDAGKLRAATASALGNRGLLANYIAKAIISDWLYWPWMQKMNSVEHAFDMAPALQAAAASMQAAIDDPGILLSDRARLFGDEMPLPPENRELVATLEKVNADEQLKVHVLEFLRRGLTLGRPKFLKHTEEYQPGGIAEEYPPLCRPPLCRPPPRRPPRRSSQSASSCRRCAAARRTT